MNQIFKLCAGFSSPLEPYDKLFGLHILAANVYESLARAIGFSAFDASSKYFSPFRCSVWHDTVEMILRTML